MCGLKILTGGADMPEIGGFLSIIIAMYYNEHNHVTCESDVVRFQDTYGKN